ncbi:MAG: Heme biosynthesis protein (NirJ-2) [Parcubacteria group bacterium GW2011_GWA2_43_9b]|nr:MAG: Heme biosynthesis protein (NirJ-2) [Parcubacteria group bacterium GW2011_GWA2_43_9b]
MTFLIRFEPLFNAYMIMDGGEFYEIEANRLEELVEGVENVRIIELSGNPDKAFGSPLKVQIQLSEHCNMRCETCAVYDRKSLAWLSTNQIFQILDKLSDVGVLNVQWSGGEPLLRADFLDLVNYAAEKGFQQNCYTNATMLTEKLALALKQQLFKMQISFDGIEEIFEAIVGVKLWKKFERGLSIAVSTGIPNVILATVLQEKNVKHMERIVRYAGTSGINRLRISMLVPIGRARHISWSNYSSIINQFRIDWPRLKKIAAEYDLEIDCFLEKEPCLDKRIDDVGRIISPGGHSFLYINAEGTMFPFPFLAGKEFKLGSIFIDDLKKTWFESGVLKNLRRQTYKNTGCELCRFECAFAERSLVYAFTGQINSRALAHPECQIERRW